MGFEPTCPFTDNRISSAARYDHFDTAPCINFVLVSRFLERHSGENRFPPLLRRTPEALILLHFLTVSFLLKPVISSRSRYDHFDTAPCINFVFVPRFLERHSGENRFSPLLRRTPEALILLHFLTVSFLLKRLISSQPRYDHFDTAAQCITLYPYGGEKSSVVCPVWR